MHNTQAKFVMLDDKVLSARKYADSLLGRAERFLEDSLNYFEDDQDKLH